MQACTHSAAGHPALFRAALHPAPLLVLPRDAVAIIQHFRGPLSAVRDLDGEVAPVSWTPDYLCSRNLRNLGNVRGFSSFEPLHGRIHRYTALYRTEVTRLGCIQRSIWIV